MAEVASTWSIKLQLKVTPAHTSTELQLGRGHILLELSGSFGTYVMERTVCRPEIGYDWERARGKWSWLCKPQSL
jgi:hypothetical protein